MSEVQVTVSSGASRAEALAQIGRLLREGVAWDAVDWVVEDRYEAVAPAGSLPPILADLPPDFLQTASAALLHADADRYLRVHRMAQRLRQQPGAWDDVLHPEHRHLKSLERQVRRDMHKMKAFVRFTCVSPTEYIAWFEPDHFVVQALGGFFQRRFASMRWSILTPRGSLRWDGGQLHAGPAAARADAPPPDAGEAMWLTYYENIFNPARIKLAAMKKEMPVRYWKNLPEARRIEAMLADAPRRVAEMVAHAAPAADPGRSVYRAARGAAPLQAREPSDFLRALAHCQDCELARHATQPVAGEGGRTAALVLVGEQPGDHEDLSGRPFVGPAGQLLRAALRDLGVDAAEVYVTNAVKHFKYEMRGRRRIHKTPAQHEVEACSRWLQEELAQRAPRLILALGRTAQRALEGLYGVPDGPIWQTPQGVPLAVVAHPAALLRAGEVEGSPGYVRWAGALGAWIDGAGVPRRPAPHPGP